MQGVEAQQEQGHVVVVAQVPMRRSRGRCSMVESSRAMDAQRVKVQL